MWFNRLLGQLSSAYAILERDFIILTSQRRFLVLRMIAPLLTSVVVAGWPVVRFMNQEMPASDRMGHELFMAAKVCLPILIALIAPGVAAPAIVSERTRRTLQVVLTTPVGPAAFVLSKFASRLGVMLVLLVATMPPGAVCFVYGGVGLDEFFDLALLCVGVAILGVSTGILCSAYSRTTVAAVLATYAITVLGPVAELAAVGGIAESIDRSGRLFQRLVGELAFSSPLFGWISTMVPTMGSRSPGLALFLGMSALSVPLLFVACRRMAAEGVGPSRAPKRAVRCRPLRFSNPVLDRCARGSLLHFPRAGTKWTLAIVVAVVLGSWFLGLANNDADDEWPYFLAMNGTSAVLAICALAYGAHSIADERDTGALNILWMTPVSSWAVLRGKLAGVLWRVFPFLLVPLVVSTLATMGSRLTLASVFAWLIASTVALTWFAVVGLRFSARSATAAKATLRGFAITIGLMVGHLLGSAAILASIQGSERMAANLLLLANPVIQVPVMTLATWECGRPYVNAHDWELLACSWGWMIPTIGCTIWMLVGINRRLAETDE